MNVFNVGQRFSFSYVSYDQDPSLDVRFKIYDVTSGTPVFLETILANYLAFGAYEGSRVGDALTAYLVIGVVYKSGSPDPDRSPTCDTYREASIQFLATAYGTYDQNDSLFIQTSVYDTSTNLPVLVSNIPMSLVDFGVYLSHFTGAVGLTLTATSAVFTDGTYTTVDINRSASSETFECLEKSVIVVELTNATLDGQSIDATILGQSVDAILEGYCA